MLNIILNPVAGKGRAANFRDVVARVFERSGVSYCFRETERRGAAKDIARDLTLKGETDIIAMGGDGTANEVLNGLVEPERVRFGLIPCGSGNDFAQAVGIPANPQAAAELILRTTPVRTDYLRCGDVRGLNVIGTGIDVDILRRSYSAKLLRGSLNYFVSLLSSVMHYEPGQMEARFSDVVEKGSAFILCACNGRQIGGGIGICPVADVGDGKLDVVLVRGMPRRKTLGALVRLMQKRILDQSYTVHALSDRLCAEFSEGVTIQIDGELYDDIPFDVSIVPGGIMMYRPEQV